MCTPAITKDVDMQIQGRSEATILERGPGQKKVYMQWKTYFLHNVCTKLSLQKGEREGLSSTPLH